MVVNIINVFSEVRKEIKSLINSNIKDPKTGTVKSRRKWIYREFPDTTSRSFEGYPILTLKSPELDDDMQDLTGVLSNGQMNFEIDIYTEFEDVNARVDDLSNQIYALFRDYTKKRCMVGKNLVIKKITAGPFDTFNEDRKKLSTRNFLVFVESTLDGSV